MTADLWTWLAQQAPVIVVMGIVIYWLAGRLVKSEDQKDTLSRDVVKLTTLFEERVDKGSERESQIIQLLNEIKTIVSQKK